jgi:cation diffusion facilitator CzcD-associated flavoprotein CzcO
MSDRRHYRAAVTGAGFGGVAVGAALGQAGIAIGHTSSWS